MDTTRDLEAHHKMDTHEKVCAERYGNLWDAIKDLRRTIGDHNTSTDVRLTAIANRMWSLLAVVAGGAIVGLAALAMYMLTKGQGG